MNNEFEMKESLDFAISGAEREIADKSVQMALDAGASAVMVSLDKAKTEIYALLDGEIDNIRQTGDRSLTFNIYADGKYGTFSTNRFEEDSLRDFLCKAVETVRMLVADPFRGLPDKKDLATDAVNGDEMGLCWYGYDSVSRDEKLEMARRVSVFGEFSASSSDRNWRVVSEEIEYNNTLSDTYLTSSDGCRCRQTETSFEVSSQVTVEDNEGNKYSGLWWDYGVSPEKVLASECGRKAVEMAVMQISPVNADKGKYTMVVSRLVAGRLLQPVLNALSSLSVYQKSSFLVDALGKQVFSKGLNVVDMPLEKGKSGAILFETDGRACRNREIITEGVVKENFTSIYMSRKLGIPPTSSCPNRPVLLPFVSEELLGGERGGGHCGVSGGELGGSGLGGDCGEVSGAGLGAASGDGRGVERGEMSGSGLCGDCGEVSGDERGADSTAAGAPDKSNIFGHDIFTSSQLTFEPNENMATPENYRLGPGDQLIIEIWGDNEDTMSKTVSPEGRIYISQIGPVYLNGLTIKEAGDKIRKMLASKYGGIGGDSPNSSISVTLGQIRTIKVNVMGDVKVPGTYRLSSFSTVFSALYRAGGVSETGSLRAIKVVRGVRLRHQA